MVLGQSARQRVTVCVCVEVQVCGFIHSEQRPVSCTHTHRKKADCSANDTTCDVYGVLLLWNVDRRHAGTPVLATNSYSTQKKTDFSIKLVVIV